MSYGEIKKMNQALVKQENGIVFYWHTNIDLTKKTLFFLHGLTANGPMSRFSTS